MSHIFDALQRSESERTGIDQFGLSLATELLQSAEEKTTHARTVDAAAPQITFHSIPIMARPASKLVSVNEKESLAAEKFRFLAVRLRQMQQVRSLKKVLITSSIPAEGKSLVAANLACTLARKRPQKTLLLEGDLRRPTLCRQFGLAPLAGVSEWLQAGSSSGLYYLENLGLWVLPAGGATENPLELMQSPRFTNMMDQLCSWFDWIVIDSPPLLPLADTSIWGRTADGILLVTRLGITEKKELQRGIETVEKSKLLGALLNSSNNAAHSDYYRHYGHAANKPQPSSSASPAQRTPNR
jgi:capsular exopolysaccharide synthesis family protein